jgi:hypothetical protein
LAARDFFRRWLPRHIRADEHRIRADEHRIRADEHRIRANGQRIRANGHRIRADGHRIRANEHPIRAGEHRIGTDTSPNHVPKETLVTRTDWLRQSMKRLGHWKRRGKLQGCLDCRASLAMTKVLGIGAEVRGIATPPIPVIAMAARVSTIWF